MLPVAIYGRGESVQIEWRHQRIRRFVTHRGTQAKAVDMPGLNVWWVADCWEAQEHSWWLTCHECDKDAKKPDEPETVEQTERKRKFSGWDVFRAEERLIGWE